ncbi:MAG: 50S ribosomal protein L11 methyltransferase [Pseudomonadota bacterium]
MLKLTGKLLDKAVPGWHFACLNDTERNAAYERALNALVTPETIVLDVGAGCGLLSLLAARAGAKHVYAVEIEPLVAEAAREIVARNGYADRITVIGKDIRDVRLGEDISERCNLVVQDIIWPEPLSKDIHHLLDYCRDTLLTDNALFLPESLTMCGMYIDAQRNLAPRDYRDVHGFDFSPMSIFASHQVTYPREFLPEKPLTNPFAIADIDLRRTFDPQAFDKSTTVSTIAAGEIHYLLRWLEMRFPDGTVLNNGVGHTSCRNMIANRVLEPITVSAGADVEISMESQQNQMLAMVKVQSGN